MAGRIERGHTVKVETVVVGDAALDEALRALVAATSEATLNAASHSGASEVSVYVEVEADAVRTAFVRDHRLGFDPRACRPTGGGSPTRSWRAWNATAERRTS